jgi:hypothetical protein
MLIRNRLHIMASHMKTIAILLLSLGASAQVAVTKPADPLLDGFVQPAEAARPRVWWHWMNGNISKDGIRLDLEWMHRVGIAGFQNFDAALATPQVVERRLAYMTPEWKDAFKYATTLADSLGMEEAIAGSPGWSESGGPWVPGPEAMKKYVWSETVLEGGKPFTGTLAHPPSVTGKFQNTPLGNAPGDTPQFYADSAVVAYEIPATETLLPKPVFRSSSQKSVDASILADDNAATSVKIHARGQSGERWLQAEFRQPVTVRSVTTSIGRPPRGTSLSLQASDDGTHFQNVTAVQPGSTLDQTLSFAPVTARYFRLLFTLQTPSADDIEVNEFVLHSGSRVNRFEDKAAFEPAADLYGFATPEVASADPIRKSGVIDLTGKMRPDGTLDWTPPSAGRWVVLRLGYSLLGITNHPATKEATGLEVDKLNAHYVKNYMDRYLDSYKETVGADFMGKRGIRYVINDSWEAGSQNWTDDMIADFTRLRGYDPHPWLPVLAGHIVESAKASDQFLWDLRKTIADLTSTEHYGQLEATLHERGMGHYGESHESGRAFIADGMEVKKYNEIPMSAMWVQSPGVNNDLYRYDADDRESASVAHIYGQNIAAAESMTANRNSSWMWSPATLKPTADKELVNGINRFVIHESAHQPLRDKAPGLTLGPYGQWFNRNETWAEQAGPWIDYLARSSYMLQQGRFAADILYFYGEDSNLTAIFVNSAPSLPAGYGFDYVNADALIHMFHADSGHIMTASGMDYRLLALDPYSKHMSLPVLRAIYALVEQGATVAGPKPTDTPSLADNQDEFHKLNDALFGDGTGVHTVGKGKVFAGQDAAAALKALGLSPDFQPTTAQTNAPIAFVHRKLADGDLYFVDNRSDRETTVDATFRVSGKAPEFWRAENGQSEAASYEIGNGATTVPLHLEPWGTVFVVFRKPAMESSRRLPAIVESPLATIDGTWQLSFQPSRGAPATVTLSKLASWTDNADPGVKYFSGVGTYTKTIDASSAWFKPGEAIWLDLGDVKELAEVSVNGTPLGVIWHAPYRVDVTKALKPGQNELSVKVVNTWVNRLIGDEQPNATKVAFTDVTPYKATSPLMPSGLIGPVQLLRQSAK